MKRWQLLVFMVLAGLLIASIACAPKPAVPQPTGPITIKIGLPVPLSGSAAPWGQIPTPYREAWVEIFNREGFQVGGKTYKLELVQVDDQNTPEGGAAAAKKLVYEDKVKFIAGHWTWNFSAIAAVTNPAKVIFVTRTGNDVMPATMGGVYNPKTMPYVVFGTPSHDEYANFCFALVEAFPDYGVLGQLDCTLGKGAGWARLDQTLDKAGIKYHHEWFPPGTTDFAPYITRFAEKGCKVVMVAGWVGEFMMFLKQRYEMGYKDMKVFCSGPFVSLDMYKTVCGADAFEGAMGAYYAPWEFKKTKVNPKHIEQCREALQIASQKTGKPYEYTGEIAWVPTHFSILVQAMQKAGTVDDPDAIMKAIRGGTFDTPIGKWTMSGEKTYGSAVVFGNPGSVCIIKGGKEVYLSEHPMEPLP